MYLYVMLIVMNFMAKYGRVIVLFPTLRVPKHVHGGQVFIKTFWLMV